MLSKWLKLACVKFINLKFFLVVFKWPGTIMHELSHALTGLVFFFRVKNIMLFDYNFDGGTTGSVEFVNGAANSFQKIGHFFLGCGPIWAGVALFTLLVKNFYPADIPPPEAPFFSVSEFSFTLFLDTINFALQSAYALFLHLIDPVNLTKPFFYFFLFCTFSISVSMELSKPDIKGMKLGIMPIFTVIFLLNLLLNWIYPALEIFVENYWSGIFSLYFFMIFTGLVMAVLSPLFIFIISISPFKNKG